MPSNLDKAKKALDSIIKKSRVHLYKPIQLAEILYNNRISNERAVFSYSWRENHIHFS